MQTQVVPESEKSQLRGKLYAMDSVDLYANSISV